MDEQAVVRAALYLDFDNFLIGLRKVDEAAAEQMLEQPAIWLNRLAEIGLPAGARRRWLILRCYMNPGGWIGSSESEGGRRRFSSFRAAFMDAGFEIVDCPKLTYAAKNAADIRMVVDALESLSARVRYDDYVIMSADSDFTPLLHALRRDDRRTMVVATGPTASAYTAIADGYVDQLGVIDLVTGRERPSRSGEADVIQLPGASTDAMAGMSADDAYAAFADLVWKEYSEADQPLNLAWLSSTIAAELGSVVSATNWFGFGGFMRAVDSLDLPDMERSQHHLWNSVRHESAVVVPTTATKDAMPDDIWVFRQAIKLPRLSQLAWPMVFEALEAYAQDHVLDLTESSQWARDYASSHGFPIGRAAFAYVVAVPEVQALLGESTAQPTAIELGRAFFAGVVRRCEGEGLGLDRINASALAEWLGLSEATPAAAVVSLDLSSAQPGGAAGSL